jgi:hypothetical protein
MKTTKTEFKALLKECLKEVLEEEGLLKNTKEHSYKRNSANEMIATKTSIPENKIEEEKNGVNPLLMEKVEQLSNSISNGNKEQNDLMRKIFADTALTTLQEQLVPGDSLGMYDPTELVSAKASNITITKNKSNTNHDDLKALSVDGDVSRWAKVAFSKK